MTATQIPSTDLSKPSAQAMQALAQQVKNWGAALGFQQVAITDANTGEHEAHLQRWLEKDFHGDMDYMQKHGTKRTRPNELLPGTVRVISVRMDYSTDANDTAEKLLTETDKAYISRYALGRDYHKLMRKRLAQLAEKIESVLPSHNRVFVDSAPVLERALAERAGLGWIGKNTMLINSKAGSYFFLGEIYTDAELPVDPPQEVMHCGSCTACIPACPTGAIVAPHQLDARRCISYLTIELHGSIPEDLRPLMGNRIYGCDDCQLVCPWNKFAQLSHEIDFTARHNLDNATLIDLFNWTEEKFLANTEGSAIRRIGYQRWLRNVAVALGNASSSTEIIDALTKRLHDTSELVVEHIHWALAEHAKKLKKPE
jgi:epoxyqueuosine reductase